MHAQREVPDPVIDVGAILAARVANDPFRWGLCRGVIEQRLADRLAETFPSDPESFGRVLRVEGKKRHDLRGVVLVGPRRPLPHLALPEPWPALLVALTSRAYRRALEVASGIDLDGLRVEISLFRQLRGGFMDPHQDHPSKVLTHLFFFEDDWRAEDGGCLRLLRSSDLDDVAVEVLPRRDTSLFFVRSESSWHGYRPIAGDRPRRSLQVVFHRSDLAYGPEIERNR